VETRKTIIDQIIFPSGTYRIIKRLYKTKGSRRQIITDDKNHPSLETMTVFYIVEKGDKKYWVKQNSDDRSANTDSEWARGTEHYDVITHSGGTIGLVKLLEKSNNALRMEYLDGYVNINKTDLFDKQTARILFSKFVDKTELVEYDFSVNNIMVKTDENFLHIRLVDLDVSQCKLKEKARRFINEYL
jgi:hypothetical protein